MSVKFDMIKKAHALNKHQTKMNEAIRKNLTVLAEQHSTTASTLTESVTNVLANLATTTSAGEPFKVMHLDSIASFLAGVETIANALPSSQDELKKQNTLRALAAAAIGPDGNVTYAVTPIAQLGARNQELRSKYVKLVQDYTMSADRGQPDGRSLTMAIRQLQLNIDQAMRQASSSVRQGPQAAASDTRPPAKAGPSQPGSTPVNL